MVSMVHESLESCKAEGREDCAVYGQILDDDSTYLREWLRMLVELVQSGKLTVENFAYPLPVELWQNQDVPLSDDSEF